MKEFVKVLFPIWRAFCSEYCSEVIALSKECEKRLLDYPMCASKIFVLYCISSTPRYVQSWAWFWIQIGSLKDSFDSFDISSYLVKYLALVFLRSKVLEKLRDISARL